MANQIIGIHGSVSALLSLSSVRAESFGNQAIEGYRIIENKLSIFTPKNQMMLKQQHQQQQQQQRMNLLHSQQRPPHMMYPMMQGIYIYIYIYYIF